MEELTKFTTDNIPRRMRIHRQWICWQPRAKDNGKVDKIPINPVSLQPAKTNDRTTWTDFSTAVASARDNDLGIGFVFAERDNMVGIDLDNCFEEGQPVSWAQDLVEQMGSYAEITPSGKGLHIIVSGELNGKRRRKGPVEVYSSGRFFTVTGNSLNGIQHIAENQEGIDEFYLTHFADDPVPVHKQEHGRILQGLQSIPAFVRLYNGDVGSYPSQSEADLALCSMVARRTDDAQVIDGIFRASGLMRDKWDEQRGEQTYGQITINKALEGAPKIIMSERNLDEEIVEYPEFPSEIMSGLAGDFAQAQAECIEAPEHFVYMAWLTSLGSILSGRATIARGLAIQPRMYVLILGETAEGRKSTAIKIVTNFFRDAFREDEEPALRNSWGVGSAEGLQKRMGEHNHLLLCLDEFKAFVSKSSIKGSVLLPAVTQLFESNNYENQTKTTHLKIENGHFSLLAASTIDTYERTWDASFSDIGFLNRLFLVVGKSERKFAFPMQMDSRTAMGFKARLRQMVHRIYNADGGLMELGFEDDAREMHNEWYMGREQSMYSRRLNVYALRLMILLAVNDGKLMIDVETVSKAIKLCDWQLEIRKNLSPIDGDNAAAVMEEKIRRALKTKGDLTRRELSQLTHAHRSGIWLFDTALGNLIRTEEVTMAQCGKTTVHHYVQL